MQSLCVFGGRPVATVHAAQVLGRTSKVASSRSSCQVISPPASVSAACQAATMSQAICTISEPIQLRIWCVRHLQTLPRNRCPIRALGAHHNSRTAMQNASKLKTLGIHASVQVCHRLLQKTKHQTTCSLACSCSLFVQGDKAGKTPGQRPVPT